MAKNLQSQKKYGLENVDKSSKKQTKMSKNQQINKKKEKKSVSIYNKILFFVNK